MSKPKLDLYPVTIIRDRYSGCYSHGMYTAFNCHPEHVPEDAGEGDPDCMMFWHKVRECGGDTGELNWMRENIYAGVGATPNEALADLHKRVPIFIIDKKTNNEQRKFD
jgi:hypothetical protein